MIKLGNWHDRIGTPYENSPHREAPNKHIKGGKKYKEMIDRGSKEADKKNLPFTFSKPPKRTQPRRDIFHLCDNCMSVAVVNKYTAGRVCSGCKNYVSINETNTFSTEKALLEALNE
jgi:hypothetical protein